ncbi:MAG: pilus assembly protein PilM, partial [Mycobacterium sp.]
MDGSFLAAAVLDGDLIQRVASAELAPGVALDGEVRDPVALAEALKDLFRKFKLPNRVRLGVANQQIVVRQLEMPMIEDQAKRDAAIRFQAAEAIAMPLEEAILDYQPIGVAEGENGVVRQRLLVVAARASMIDKLMQAVRGAGLKADGIDLNAFALVRMLGAGEQTAPNPDEAARVLCHLGGVTNLAIAAGPVCLFTRP